MTKSPKKEDFYEISAAILFFYLLPIASLSYGIIPRDSNHLVLVIMSLIMVAYAISKPISARSLGFRADNFFDSLRLAGIFTAILMFFLFGAAKIGIVEPKYSTESPWFYLFYIFISVPLQEFVFRSLIFFEMDKYFKKGITKVALSALIFSFAHFSYQDPIVLSITLIVGLVWGYVYLSRPNFWTVTISHTLLGVATVFLGFV
ncbi:MAG: CPBP family intramembrane metalloprotease [Patescibacteria group bacterium]|nr:CPBP family intramembrane metalloprotease [Patescibacteria group bacterium]